MTPFEELDRYLARDFNPDYWYDEACELATQWVAKFTPADWSVLGSQWQNRSAEWQGRCAYSLIGTLASHSATILLQMAASPDDEVASTAVDALNSLNWRGERPNLKPELIARLERLSASNPSAAMAVQALLRHADGQMTSG